MIKHANSKMRKSEKLPLSVWFIEIAIIGLMSKTNYDSGQL